MTRNTNTNPGAKTMMKPEVYKNTDYLQRKNQWFKVGDLVKVGPAFRMGGEYVSDGAEGDYIVAGIMGGCGDYKLTLGDVADAPGHFDMVINVARMVKR